MNTFSRLTNRARDFLYSGVLEDVWWRRLRGTVTCLLYHRVDEPSRFPFLTDAGAPTITPRRLENELRWLRGRGARFLTFADLRQGRFPTADDVGFILSFDDGFRQRLHNEYPGIPVGALGEYDPSDLDWLDQINVQHSALTQDEVDRAKNAGVQVSTSTVDDRDAMEAAWRTPEGQRSTAHLAEFADLARSTWSVVSEEVRREP